MGRPSWIKILASPGAPMKFVSQLLSAHLARYPAMQLDDIYKLLHQAALGPGHAVDNPAAARKRLDQEMSALGEAPAGPLRDIISPDGQPRPRPPAFLSGGWQRSRCAPQCLPGNREELSGIARQVGEILRLPGRPRRCRGYPVRAAGGGGVLRSIARTGSRGCTTPRRTAMPISPLTVSWTSPTSPLPSLPECEKGDRLGELLRFRSFAVRIPVLRRVASWLS